MKRDTRIIFEVAAIVLLVGLLLCTSLTGAQEREKGPRKPEPVAQNWRVHVVSADELQAKLEELNRAAYMVTRQQILPVGDKLVILVSDDSLNYPPCTRCFAS